MLKTSFFISKTFIRNVRVNLTKIKQILSNTLTFLLFENYSHSSYRLPSKKNRIYSKN